MKDEVLKLAKECGATTYTNRHYPEATAVTFSPVAWEKFCEQALAAQPAVQEPVAYLFTNVQSGDIESSTDPDYKEGEREMWFRERLVRPAAQPAVPDAIHHTDLSEHPQYIEGWNDCRAEMLKGMKP
jgi:hypothetical protein